MAASESVDRARAEPGRKRRDERRDDTGGGVIVYSETVVWPPPAELASEAPYQLVLVESEGVRVMGHDPAKALHQG